MGRNSHPSPAQKAAADNRYRQKLAEEHPDLSAQDIDNRVRMRRQHIDERRERQRSIQGALTKLRDYDDPRVRG
jgi:hypothetical protein